MKKIEYEMIFERRREMLKLNWYLNKLIVNWYLIKWNLIFILNCDIKVVKYLEIM